MHKNYKGYLITWKEIYIDNKLENLVRKGEFIYDE